MPVSQRSEARTPIDVESLNGAHKWDHALGLMKNRFLQSQPKELQEVIFAKADATADVIDKWASQFEVVRQVRVWPVALTMAAAAPFLSPATLAACGMLNMWIFTLDDQIDEGFFHVEEVSELAIHLTGIAQKQIYPNPYSDLSVGLFQVIQELGRFGNFRDYRHLWADALTGMMEGMVQEAYWAKDFGRNGRSMLPDLSTYLKHGRYSVGGPPHIWAMLLMIGDQSIGRVLAELEQIERLASTAIRLANDLRSHQKEAAEGKLNALVILADEYEKGGLTTEAAQARAVEKVEQLIHQQLMNLAWKTNTPLTSSGKPEESIVNVANFVCDFYGRYDFHSFKSDLSVNQKALG